MKLPIINIQGYEVGLINDDFEKDSYSVKKSFYINGLKSIILYSNYNRMIEIRYQIAPTVYKVLKCTANMIGLENYIIRELLKDN